MSVIKKVLLKDIVANYPKENIVDWNYATIDSSTRLYIKLVDEDNKKSGFFFYVAFMTSHISGREWDINESEIECLYEGIAYFDGIRHLYMGSEQTDNYGYDYYPNLEQHIKVMIALMESTKLYCQED